MDVHARKIYPARVQVDGQRITSIVELASDAVVNTGFLICGFVDAHVHVESSMLAPAEFARVAVRHGTVATVSDPHEIANVLGEEGIEFMLREAESACMPIAFGVPSCVPATQFETTGSSLDATAVARLLSDARLSYLAEMMNWPGVLSGDGAVLEKIAASKRVGKPVDGHAPGLRGAEAQRYVAAGISTDHECFALEEAREKARAGMHILIREGSAARNLEALWPIIAEFPQLAMFSTDDAHPDMLALGHINRSVARCISHGLDLFDVLRAASVNPVEHYRLQVGLLREGDRADFAIVEDLKSFEVRETWIGGREVARAGQSLVAYRAPATPNRFRSAVFSSSDFALRDADMRGRVEVRVIEAIDGELITREIRESLTPAAGVLEPDPATDTLLICVCNRFQAAPPALAFVRGFGFLSGAVATSVAHDSHQVIAVGTSRDAIVRAVNAVFAAHGGLVVVNDRETKLLPLPIAGLMSDRPVEEVAEAYLELSEMARALGSKLRAPFMTLSFMALLVIPALKLSDLGLFDAREFRFVPPIVR